MKIRTIIAKVTAWINSVQALFDLEIIQQPTFQILNGIVVISLFVILGPTFFGHTFEWSIAIFISLLLIYRGIFHVLRK